MRYGASENAIDNRGLYRGFRDTGYLPFYLFTTVRYDALENAMHNRGLYRGLRGTGYLPFY